MVGRMGTAADWTTLVWAVTILAHLPFPKLYHCPYIALLPPGSGVHSPFSPLLQHRHVNLGWGR